MIRRVRSVRGQVAEAMAVVTAAIAVVEAASRPVPVLRVAIQVMDLAVKVQAALVLVQETQVVSMAITFDPLSAIKIDPPTIMFYSLFALIDSFHLQA